ncbi:MAG: pantetheine-phosphate adenylyltransferase [Clostridia bacterium]|nr:pantetheine-phosphate adenylyltransferase [Clostridia bacterium]
MKRTAVFSGTFDPVTVGHRDIIERAAKLFDELHVVIAHNPEKKTMFTPDERLGMLEATVGGIDGADNVVCAVWERPVFEYCRAVGAKYIVKGIRSAADYDYEKILARQTVSLSPETETVILFSDEKYDHISSTYVRGCIEYGYPLNDSVPEEAVSLIEGKK